MADKVDLVLNQQANIRAEIRQLKASIEAPLAVLHNLFSESQKELDETVAEIIEQNTDRIFSDAALVKRIHTVTYANGTGLPLSSRKLREAVPSGLSLNTFGGWRSLFDSSESDENVFVYSPQVMISDDTTLENLTATAEWVEKLVDAAETILAESSSKNFKMLVMEHTLSQNGTFFIERDNNMWFLKASSWGMESVFLSAGTLVELFTEMRADYHS